ncbi:hypothetical protein [Undibacterium sp. Xuan67W]|uniref:hypothetical protein n=1 Tax=Undibacterium sp. Xuan67W TaxID=3413057 RepID=UPI003BF13420
MIINDSIINRRQVSAYFDDSDLYALLSQKVAVDTGFPIDPRKTKISVTISKKDSSTGFTNYAEVTLTNDLTPTEE